MDFPAFLNPYFNLSFDISIEFVSFFFEVRLFIDIISLLMRFS